MRVELLVTAGPAQGKTFTFEQPDCFLFGRADDARIALPKDDKFVSRNHFMLIVAPPACKVLDLRSGNGVFVNGVRYGGTNPLPAGVQRAPDGASEALLKDGDTIGVGVTQMVVRIQADVYCESCGTVIVSGAKAAQAAEGSGRGDEAQVCAECRNKTLLLQTGGSAGMPPPLPAAADRRDAGGTGRQDTGATGAPAAADRRDAGGTGRQDAGATVIPAVPGAPHIPGYRIEKVLGRGGMGVVFGAVQEQSGRPVAIKTILPKSVRESMVKAFQREIEVQSQLKHPNVVELLALERAGTTLCVVLELVDGMDLAQFVKSRGGRVSLAEAAPIMLGALDGLGYAHAAPLTVTLADGSRHSVRGIVHRDLKPENILLGKSPGGWTAKLADLGLSKSFETSGLSGSQSVETVAGTPPYWPREHITAYRYLYPASDVFSIAAVFYKLLTGVHAREGLTEMMDECSRQNKRPGYFDFVNIIMKRPIVPIRARDPGIPEAVAGVLDRALREKEIAGGEETLRMALAELRYPHAGVFRQALAGALRQ